MRTNRRTFLRQLGFGTAGVSLLTLTPGCRTHLSTHRAGALPRSTPEAEGVSPEGILAFLQAVQGSRHELHSFMVLRHGKVVAEGWWSPYGPRFNHTLYSLSKSFTSTAVGFAVSEGQLRVEDPVVSFFPNDLPSNPSEHLADLRVKHLLTMSVGNAKEPTRAIVNESNWVRAFLAWPIENAPGSQFLYNSAATYMLSAIVQQVTGQRVLEYLQPRLFGPLGIQGATWETCPRGINVGGWGLSVPTEALAKMGQLYLRKGIWEGRQLLPAAWVEEATTFKIQQPSPANPSRPKEANDWLQGYCYQFWRCTHHAFRGDGAFGQFLVVMPEQDAVVVITGESHDLQGELDLVWKHLLPAMQPEPLASQVAAQRELTQSLASLSLPPLPATALPGLAGQIDGKHFEFDQNVLGLQSVSFRFENRWMWVTFMAGGEHYPIACGLGRWERGETALPGTPPRLIGGGAPAKGTKAKVAASGHWAAPTTWEMLLRFYETPHHQKVTCRFEGNNVRVTFLDSITAMNPSAASQCPELLGRMVS